MHDDVADLLDAVGEKRNRDQKTDVARWEQSSTTRLDNCDIV